MAEHLPAPHARADDDQAHVLLVDDASLVRLYYRTALEAAGFKTTEAVNGVEALEKALSEPYHLIVADINMPKMDGLSFVQALRRHQGISTIPVLVTSTESAEADVAAARRAGANFYLVKPVSQEDLVLYVRVLTGLSA